MSKVKSEHMHMHIHLKLIKKKYVDALQVLKYKIFDSMPLCHICNEKNNFTNENYNLFSQIAQIQNKILIIIHKNN